MPPGPFDAVDRLKRELDSLRPLPPETAARVAQKLRMEANYHSNAIEGNSLTLGETRGLLLHGLTARGKPLRDHIDIQGHDSAVKAVEAAVREKRGITQAFIRNLHGVLLKEPYEAEAVAPDGARVKRTIQVGAYKAVPNNVVTSTGETRFFTPPGRVQMEMTDLIDRFRRGETEGEHPIVLAAAFHYRFVRIHPFDDGNGRMARLLMNMILIRHGYTVAIVTQDERTRYIETLERIDRTEQLAEFIEYIASRCERTLDLHLRAARGESIEDEEDIDREISLFKRSVMADATYEGTELRSCVENVLFPFYVYCKSRIKEFSDLFVSIPQPEYAISGVDTNNDRFWFKAGDAVPLFGSDLDTSPILNLYVLPEKSREYECILKFHMNTFIKGDVSVVIIMKIHVKWLSSNWVFEYYAGDNSGSENFQGCQSGPLRDRFNRMLRNVMKALNSPQD